jgi:hypothetical protein
LEATGRAINEYLAVLRCRVRGRDRGHAEVRFALRSGGALDRSARRTGPFLRTRRTTWSTSRTRSSSMSRRPRRSARRKYWPPSV